MRSGRAGPFFLACGPVALNLLFLLIFSFALGPRRDAQRLLRLRRSRLQPFLRTGRAGPFFLAYGPVALNLLFLLIFSFALGPRGPILS